LGTDSGTESYDLSLLCLRNRAARNVMSPKRIPPDAPIPARIATPMARAIGEPSSPLLDVWLRKQITSIGNTKALTTAKAAHTRHQKTAVVKPAVSRSWV
jgi:hypothetical protein